MNTLWVGLGGALGSIARYHIGRVLLRVAFGVGVLGGFTTYSTFNYETFAHVQSGTYGRAALYLGVTLVGGFLLGVAGWAIGRSL